MRRYFLKYKEMIFYLLFGGLSFLVSTVSYAVLPFSISMNELTANLISWVVTVLFAFVTNRIWVFQAHTKGPIEFLRQAASFYGSRVVTLLVEELILFVFITRLAFPGMAVKVAAQVVVIVLNYVLSKCWIFRNGSSGEEPSEHSCKEG